jgi:hypothetical protein
MVIFYRREDLPVLLGNPWYNIKNIIGGIMIRKYLYFLLAPALFFMFFTSCATFDKAAMERTKNVAVLSIYCDKRIDSSEFTGLGAAIAELAQNKDFKLDNEVMKMKDDLFNEYTKVFSFKLLDEPAVLGIPNYMTADQDKSFFKMDPKMFVCPPGYRAYSIILKQPVLNLLKELPAADAGMIMYTTFRLRKLVEFLGFGTAKVDSFVYLIVKDKEFKTVFYKDVTGSSTETIKFALGGVFDATKIQPLCAEASADAGAKMKKWLMTQYTK